MTDPVPPLVTPSAADTQSQLKQHSDSIEKLQAGFKSMRTAQSGISNTFAGISNTVTALSTSVAALTLSIGVGISLFKVDEKGITIFGATREFPWKRQIENLQKRIESQAQRTERENSEARNALIDNNRRYIERLSETEADVRTIKDRLRRAALAAEHERSRLQADPSNRTDRGIDAARPIVRGVTSDVRVLRSAVDVLTEAFA
ncbi:hypothetical protein AB0I84_08700 [Streptomyces spectabilis]|uniref:hypothetical protein n=1 Tax=Streptomyces spectabilis TaxID=68270 RepID=UPI00340FFFC9